MKYKILHLPSATCMYYDIGDPSKENYLFTEFELENNYYTLITKEIVFPNKKTVLKYYDKLKYYFNISKLDKYGCPDSFVFYEGDTNTYLLNHFEIVSLDKNGEFNV